MRNVNRERALQSALLEELSSVRLMTTSSNNSVLLPQNPEFPLLVVILIDSLNQALLADLQHQADMALELSTGSLHSYDSVWTNNIILLTTHPHTLENCAILCVGYRLSFEVSIHALAAILLSKSLTAKRTYIKIGPYGLIAVTPGLLKTNDSLVTNSTDAESVVRPYDIRIVAGGEVFHTNV